MRKITKAALVGSAAVAAAIGLAIPASADYDTNG